MIQVSVDGVTLDFTCQGHAYPPSGWILDTRENSIQVSLYACDAKSMWQNLIVLFPSNSPTGEHDCPIADVGPPTLFLFEKNGDYWTTDYSPEGCKLSLTEVRKSDGMHAAGSGSSSALEYQAGGRPPHSLSVKFNVPHS